MSAIDVDVVVVGAGPGGESVGGLLGKAGLEVVVVEEHLVGGECPFYGCVPSKLMISGARHAAEGAGDWAHVVRRIQEEATDHWHDDRFAERLTGYGARLVRGRGRLAGPRAVRVGDDLYRARRGVVLNTGTRPSVPPIPGLAETPFWTNRDIVRVEALPASLAVLGAGPIGVELAQVFARFGVEVSVIDQSERVLPREEPAASEVLAEGLRSDGVRLLLGRSVASVSHDADGFTLQVEDGDGSTSSVRAERLLVAAGRTPQLDDLGLDTVGIDPGARLEVDDHQRVRGTEPGLWAIGDITGEGPFTHVSNYQARVAVRDILGEDGPWADYRALVRVTYTEPEVAAVGLTEEQARSGDGAIEVASGDLGARGWLDEAEGVITLVAKMDGPDAADGVLVGATVAGPTAGEVIGLLAAAVHARMPLSQLRTMHYAYPTYHRAIETVLWRLPH